MAFVNLLLIKTSWRSLFAIVFTLLCANARGDETVNWPTGSNPANPADSVQFRYRHETFAHGHPLNRSIFRINKVQQLPDNLRLGHRLEVNYESKDHHSGLGDLYYQAILVRGRRPETSPFIGLRVYFPTASHPDFGHSQYVLAPFIGMISYYSRGFYGILFREFEGVSNPRHGKERTSDLQIEPCFHIDFNRGWFTQIKSDIIVNWNLNGKAFIPYIQEVGKKWSPRFVTSIRGSIALLKEDPHYERYLEGRLTYFY